MTCKRVTSTWGPILIVHPVIFQCSVRVRLSSKCAYFIIRLHMHAYYTYNFPGCVVSSFLISFPTNIRAKHVKIPHDWVLRIHSMKKYIYTKRITSLSTDFCYLSNLVASVFDLIRVQCHRNIGFVCQRFFSNQTCEERPENNHANCLIFPIGVNIIRIIITYGMTDYTQLSNTTSVKLWDDRGVHMYRYVACENALRGQLWLKTKQEKPFM